MKRKGQKPIIIGSIYHPPNNKPKKFNPQYLSLLTKLKTQKKEIILGMDQNLNLLKSCTHVETQTFIDINFDNYLFPCITCPTGITKSTATLIDNIFISQNLHNSFDACVVVHDPSDHLPSIINVHDQESKKVGHLEFTCRSLDNAKIVNINKELLTVDWSQLNDTDVNIALDEFQKQIEDCLDTHAPLKLK